MNLFEEAERRLVEYGNVLRHPIALRTGVRSIFARIVEMKENSAVFGSGAPYDNIQVEGVWYSVRSDGGMADLVNSQQSSLRALIRAKETHDAVQTLRAPLRRLVTVTWLDLPPGKESQTVRAAADTLEMTLIDYRAWRIAVLGILDAKLSVPHFIPADERELKAA